LGWASTQTLSRDLKEENAGNVKAKNISIVSLISFPLHRTDSIQQKQIEKFFQDVSLISPRFRSAVLHCAYPANCGGSSMHKDKQPTGEFKITAGCTITDPVERQRRLAQAYGLIMDFGQQKRVVAEIESDAQAQSAD
jgi:hypothetical protein